MNFSQTKLTITEQNTYELNYEFHAAESCSTRAAYKEGQDESRLGPLMCPPSTFSHYIMKGATQSFE